MKVYTKMKQSKRKTIHFFISANNKDFFYTKEIQETLYDSYSMGAVAAD